MLRKVMVMAVVAILTACSSQPPAPVTSVYTGKSYRDFKANHVSDKSHTVSAGDTLYSIAFRAGKDFRDLANVNGISPPYRLNVGQVIKLTSDPKLVKNTSISKSVSSSSKRKNLAAKRSGQTSAKSQKKPIDRSKKQEYVQKQGYGNVNNSVTTQQGYAKRVTKWIWPASGKLVTQFSAKEQGSKGIDIAGRAGQQVVASADGKVVYAGDALRGFGNLVIIKHTDDYLSAYAHNSKILVKEKQWVKAGDSVALMGDTDAPRVQLHFEIRYRGKSIDPLKHLAARS